MSSFDRIDHEWLLEHIPLPKWILRQWLKSGYMEATSLHPTEAGTPQGGIISPILANMALDGLQVAVLAGLDKKACKLNVIRYADDFVVTGATESLLRETIQPRIEAFLAVRGLNLSPEKTQIRPIDQGFDFLGFNIRKFGDKLLTQPCPTKARAFLDNITSFLRGAYGMPFEALLRALYSKLRGWAFANRRFVAKRLFANLDRALYRLMCRWLRRQHSNKTWAWISHRYRHHLGGRWSFGTGVFDKQGNRQWMELFRMSDLPIRRHGKIRSFAHPYNPAYWRYFRERFERNRMIRRLDRAFLSMTPLERAFAGV